MKNLLIPFNSMLESEGRKPIVPVLDKSIKEYIMIPPAEPQCPPIDTLRSLPIVLSVLMDNNDKGGSKPYVWRKCSPRKQHFRERHSKYGANLHKGRKSLHCGRHLQHETSSRLCFRIIRRQKPVHPLFFP